MIGDWDAPAELIKLASQVDIVALENEFVSPDSLQALTDNGYSVLPSARTISLIQDKLLQKSAVLPRRLEGPILLQPM